MKKTNKKINHFRNTALYQTMRRLYRACKSAAKSYIRERELEKVGLSERQYQFAVETNAALMEFRRFGREEFPLFCNIEIETLNRCNGECEFCAVNRHDDTRPLVRMKEELFYKIIDELAELHYTDKLAFHSNNEPLLDTRIEKFVQYARKKLPDACLFMYTNGSLLTPERYLQLMQHLTYMVIDNYSIDGSYTEPIQKIVNLLNQNGNLRFRTTVDKISPKAIRSSRGGNAPNKKNIKTRNMPCINTYTSMVIRPDGKVSLCCCDTLGKVTMGDVSKESLKDVWYSEKFFAVRELIGKGRVNHELCKQCDMTMTYKWNSGRIL